MLKSTKINNTNLSFSSLIQEPAKAAAQGCRICYLPVIDSHFVFTYAQLYVAGKRQRVLSTDAFMVPEAQQQLKTQDEHRKKKRRKWLAVSDQPVLQRGHVTVCPVVCCIGSVYQVANVLTASAVLINGALLVSPTKLHQQCISQAVNFSLVYVHSIEMPDELLK